MSDSYWWLSFAADDGFRGVALVGPAHDMVSAVAIAHRRKCNPGGQVRGVEIPPEFRVRIPADRFNRVLTAKEARDLDAALKEPA